MTNPGEFLPEKVERVLRPGYNPPFYRNQLLAASMVNFNMIDTQSSGIQKVYRIQRDKYFPMPDYDFSTEMQVGVTVYGKSLNEAYMYILFDQSGNAAGDSVSAGPGTKRTGDFKGSSGLSSETEDDRREISEDLSVG
ncbi:MAG: hypothetical protein LUG99_05280 [Lachnospiraceae bacterium]|nr:hypothetical protein [Lachnospiraceae bacterium]